MAKTYLNLTFLNVINDILSDSHDPVENLFDTVKLLIGMDLLDYQKEDLRQQLRWIKSKYNTKWQAASRNSDRFLQQNQTWLSNNMYLRTEASVEQPVESEDVSNMSVVTQQRMQEDSNISQMEVDINLSQVSSSSKRGRPEVPFSEASSRAKRKKVGDLEHYETDLLLETLIKKTQTENPALHQILRTVNVAASSGTLNDIENKLKNPPLKCYTPQEAKAFLFSNDLNVNQYKNIQSDLQNRNASVLPPYYKVLESKKLSRPEEEVTITRWSACINLKPLVKQTLESFIKATDEVIVRLANGSNKDVELLMTFSRGTDASSDHSLHKQELEEGKTDRIFVASTINPLLLSTPDRSKIVWKNKTPGSTNFLRPWRIKIEKDTKEFTLAEEEEMTKQVQELPIFEIPYSLGLVKVRCEVYNTMIDGKVFQMLTGTPSTQTCQICGCTPKFFSQYPDLIEKGEFLPDETRFLYGLCPLHCLLRIFDMLLGLGEKSTIKEMKLGKDEYKQIVEARKEVIKKEMKEKLNLIVNVPLPGGSGNTNDGNTARRAFQNYRVFAEILGIDEKFVKNLYILITCVNLDLFVCPTKFEELAKETHELYIKHFSKWGVKMPVTLHRLLHHGGSIIRALPLPTGTLSESASESLHKVIRKVRRSRSRQCSREATNYDIFMNLLDRSEPETANMIIQKHTKKRNPLPPIIIDMLCDKVNIEDQCDYISDEE